MARGLTKAVLATAFSLALTHGRMLGDTVAGGIVDSALDIQESTRNTHAAPGNTDGDGTRQSLRLPDSLSEDLPESRVSDWVDSISARQTQEAGILSSSLFNTFTLTADPSLATSYTQQSAFQLPTYTTTIIHETSNSPNPTLSAQPLVEQSFQKPLFSLDTAWKTAKAKLHALSSLVCLKHDSQQQQQQQLPLGYVPDLAAEASATVATDASYFYPDSLIAEDSEENGTQRKPVPSRPLVATTSTSISAAGLVPTVTSALHVLTQPLINATGAESKDSTSYVTLSGNQYALAIFLSILITFTVFLVIFHVVRRRNPQRRADRLARWEECKNRSEFAKAAIRHRIRSWGSATFGRLWVLGSTLTTTEIVGLDFEKDAISHDASAGNDTPSGEDMLIEEVLSFQNAHERVEALIRAEEGFVRGGKRKHPADRNRRRTYMWLFGGRRQRPRANSASESDTGSEHSDGEKSAVTNSAPLPPYEEAVNHRRIDDDYLIRLVTGARDKDDRSSISSLVPTSPKEGSFTLGSSDSYSEKDGS